MIETNKNLASALEKVENRCAVLENKNRALKKYYKIYKTSVSIQCQHCRKYIYSNLFESHMNYCTQTTTQIEEEAEYLRNDTPNYQFQILESRLVNNQNEATHLEYLLNITDVSDDNNINNCNIDKSWQVWKRIKHVHTLQKGLDELFKNTTEMPPSVQVMKQ